MASSRAGMTRADVESLLGFFRLLLAAGEAGRDFETIGKTARERWDSFPVHELARRLTRPAAHYLSGFGWMAIGPIEHDRVQQYVASTLQHHGHALTDPQLRSLLIAGAFWIDPHKHRALQDIKALAALEELNGLVHGYAQSLPLRRLPDENSDSLNQSFRAYQRRRYGYETNVRSPHLIMKRLPIGAHELIDVYTERVVHGSLSSATALAATIAVAIGRPIDDTIAHQLNVTLSTATIWREMDEFPQESTAHPLIGLPNVENQQKWNAVYPLIDDSMAFLSDPDLDSTDPAFIQTPSRQAVANVGLNAQALSALQRLDDYVNTFAAWLKHGPGVKLPADERLPTFDRAWRRNESPTVSSGGRIVASLPASAVKVIANFDALIARGKTGQDIAVELSRALGDEAHAARLMRTLHVAASWLNGELSRLETARAPARLQETPPDRQPVHDQLAVFRESRPHDVEALLEFGGSIGEIVRFSRGLDPRQGTPAEWWTRFHQHDLGGIPSRSEFIARLPEGSKKILALYRELLSDDRFGDLAAIPRELANVLDRTFEVLCVRTLAIAVSVGAIWIALEETAICNNTLLGVEPLTPRQRYLCGRAQAQLEWGLQELLKTDTIIGV